VNIAIQNLVATASLGKCVLLDKLAASFKLDSIFDAALFPGLRLQLSNPDVKALLFARGKVVLTGARNRRDVALAWSIVQNIAKPFCTDEDTDHRALQTNKNAKRKQKVTDTFQDNKDEFFEKFKRNQ
jgi:hypothetical protein